MAGWSKLNIGDIAEIDGWVPIRRELGVDAFGINAWLPQADARLIGEHNEVGTGHRELYFVVRGQATFTIDGEEFEAEAGSLVYVAEPATRRSATGEPGTLVLAIGAPAGRAFTPSAWEVGAEFFPLYRAGDYESAFVGWEAATHQYPDAANLHYNTACVAALTGRRDVALAHLRQALELDREAFDPAEDSDLATLRDDPDFQSLVGS